MDLPGHRANRSCFTESWFTESRFTHLPGRTLRFGSSICLNVDWIWERACEQQTADEKEQESFHDGTPFSSGMGSSTVVRSATVAGLLNQIESGTDFW